MKRKSKSPGSIGKLGASARWLLLLGGLVGLLSGCSGTGGKDSAPGNPPDLSDVPDAVPKVEPRSKYGNPKSYVVFGKRYHTKKKSNGHVERGLASWYGKKFHGRRTSSGERYNMYAMTAAHKTLPLPTYAKVTNKENGRTAVVRINDRGPFHGKRVIDLSYAAARKLGVVKTGTAYVEVKAIDPRRPESTEGDDLFVATGSEKKRKPLARKEVVVAKKVSPARKEVVVAKKVSPARKETVVAKKMSPANTEKPLPDGRGSASSGEVAVQVARADTTPATGHSVTTPAAHGSRASGSALYLQVGAFGSRLNAEQLQRRLVDHLAEQVQVRSSDGRKAALYKVQVGPLDSREKADDLSQRLASLGLTQSHVIEQ